ncbi:putative GPI anchored protein [Aspergillus pseudodeflectus]|uniref:GPI anchored protein n=1 Tax=Aspergillus pseudodeflectus TaxID=176178 RepID=A0ABR4KHW5_9EURO
MRLAHSALLPLLSTAIAAPAESHGDGAPPPCRFAVQWTQDKILARTDEFIWDMLYWEGKFHQDGIAYNQANGMSYDGSQIDWVTGERTEKHTFSAASKEALQIMLYARAIDGSLEAARFLSPDNLKDASGLVFALMEKKLETYIEFNETYPGFGGNLPWFAASERYIAPQPDWQNRVPALDNGELWWAVYAYIHALQKTDRPDYAQQAEGWQRWLETVTNNMLPIFYRGNGVVCAVTEIGDQTLPVDHPDQTYKCEGSGVLNDPYEGELVAYFFHLFGDLSTEDKDALWVAKRPQLVRDEYKIGGVGPITVERGYWFSGHEPWKVLELPFYDVDIIRRVYHNNERVRTCNSVLTKVPGLFASVNNITDPETDTIIGYISPAGIPSIANQTEQYLDVITPYATWPTIMFDKGVGLAWWHNMVSGKKMQNPYGSTESTRVDGAGVSALLTWDSKVLTVVSILGGVGDLVREGLKAAGVYYEFIQIAEREYSLVFGKKLKGEKIAMCLPKKEVPDAGLDDFTSCQA